MQSDFDALHRYFLVIVFACCFLQPTGTGSVLTLDGEVEMDAVVMEGRNLKAGGIACVQNIKNPCVLARLVLDKVGRSLDYPGYDFSIL